MIRLIEIIVFLLAFAAIYWVFFQYILPFFKNGLRPGWLTEKEKEEPKPEDPKEEPAEQPESEVSENTESKQ